MASPRCIETLTKDLSEGGVRVVTNLFLPTASELSVELPLYRHVDSVRGRAKVMWTQRIRYSDQYHVGLEFVQLTPECRRELTTYLHDALVSSSA